MIGRHSRPGWNETFRCLEIQNDAIKEMPMKPAVATLMMLAVVGIVVLSAQQAGFKRTVVQQGNLSIPGREVVTAVAEFQPGATVGRHTHPGEEAAYILEGTVVLEQEGKPAVTLSAGQAFLIPAGTVHNATNQTKAPARVLATYIVEKGKPLATPAGSK
jgi:quercetin dioxygenase-like cupin family protein